jgi:hypothetical protein
MFLCLISSIDTTILPITCLFQCSTVKCPVSLLCVLWYIRFLLFHITHFIVALDYHFTDKLKSFEVKGHLG